MPETTEKQTPKIQQDYRPLPVMTQHLALRTAEMSGRLIVLLTRLLLAVAFVVVTAQWSQAAQLKPETEQAWNQFVQQHEATALGKSLQTGHFLHVDQSAALRNRVRQGQIAVYPVQGKGTINVPSGLIHDWVGVVFVPHRSIPEVLAALRSYAQYPEYYDPAVLEAKLINQEKNSDTFSMLLKLKVLSMDAGLNGQYRATFHEIDDRHWTATTASTRLQEMVSYGHDNQRTFSPDEGNGFVWRLYSTARYEAADGGVYIQLETLALSRSIPGSLRWIVSPIVEKVSRGALTTTLRQTRDALAVSGTASPLMASSISGQ